MTLARWLSLGTLLAFTLWCLLPILFRDDYIVARFAPSPVALALFAFGAVLALGIRDLPLRFFACLWLVWPVAGTYFSLAHFYQRKLWAPLDLVEPNVIFLGNVIVLIAAIRGCSALLSPQRQTGPIAGTPPLHMLPLLVFPLFYGISLIATGPTLLSLTSIVADMYSTDRGPLYPFRIALVPAFAYLALYVQHCPARLRPYVIGYIGLTFLLSVLDGKRDMALLGILVFIYTFIARRPDLQPSRFLFWPLIAIVLYGLVGHLRDGRGVDLLGWTSLATVAGIEYRDFAHSINYWSLDYIDSLGYDFFGSSLAMLANSTLLDLFNIDKQALVLMDSARTWQRAFGVDVGIRIGLVGELYYALNGRAEPAMVVLGLLVCALRRRLSTARSEHGFIYLATAMAVLTLSLFSQASAMFGYALTLAYIAIALWVWQFLLRLGLRASPA